MVAVNPGHWLPFYRTLNQQLHRDRICAGEPATSIYAHELTLLPWAVVGVGMSVSAATLVEITSAGDVDVYEAVAAGEVTVCSLSDTTSASSWQRTVVIGATPFDCGTLLYWRVSTAKGTIYSEVFQVADTSKLSTLTWDNTFPLPGLRYESFQQVAYFKAIWDRPEVDQEVDYEENIAGEQIVSKASYTERSAFECMYMHPVATLALKVLEIHNNVLLDDPVVGSLILKRVNAEPTPVGSCYSKFRITFETASIESVGVSFEDAPTSNC